MNLHIFKYYVDNSKCTTMAGLKVLEFIFVILLEQIKTNKIIAEAG